MPRPLQTADLPGSANASLFEGADHGSSVSFFLSRHPPGEGPGLHRHPYEETFILEEGRVTFTVDGETIEAEPGQIVVVPPNTPHRFECSGDGPLRMVSIHPADRVEQEWLDR